MQNTSPAARARYRERLSPSFWLLVSAVVVAPMVALTLLPLDPVIALVAGVLAAAALVAALLWSGPVVAVEAGVLRAGRAHIDVRWLGEVTALTGDAARRARGPALPADGWHLIRGGIDGVVVIENIDPDDPIGSWTISTRTPDRLAAAIRTAR